MDRERLLKLIKQVTAGDISEEEAVSALSRIPFTDLDFAKVDHHRPLRTGQEEVIFCRGKTPEQTAAIAAELVSESGRMLATKAAPEHFAAVKAALPEAVFNEAAGIITVGEFRETTGSVLIISAGTSDQPVAEEAALTAAFLGSKVGRLYDAGVAGVHRLLARQDLLAEARVIIAVAGMEGALPSVVAGLTRAPVIAVPTSIGYGASYGGLAALLAMVNSCAPGVAVVNIDNGFGAGYMGHLINSGTP